MDKINTLLLTALLASSIAGLVIGLQPAEYPEPVITNFGYSGYNELGDGFSETLVNISNSNLATATNQALAANTAVAYRRIQNVGNTMVTCHLDDATSTLANKTGIVLYASSSVNSIYEIGPDNLYKGKITCISESSTGTLSVTER